MGAGEAAGGVDRGHVEPGGPAVLRRAVGPSGPIEVRKLCVGPLENNVYVLSDEASGQAVLIDAADEPERILGELGGREVVAVLTTHGHADHWQALGMVAAATGARTWLHPDDAAVVAHPYDEPAVDGAVITAGGIRLHVLHTPGHTPGSVCALLDAPAEDGSVSCWLFSGDTLFPGGPGATRDPRSSFPEIIASLRSQLFTLPDATRVCPGHGDDTTIGWERGHVDAWEARGW